MKQFKGTGVALITPFTNDNQVDTESLSKLVKHQVANGIDYLVVLGSTAESVTLSTDEKKLVMETVIKANNKSLPLVLGMTSNNTADLLRQIDETDLKDFDAILSACPYYNKPSQEGIFQHFDLLAKNTQLPIILYNVPGRTAKNIEPQTVKRLADQHEHIIGIKEAAGELNQAMELISINKPEFLVISGEDGISLPMVLMGGAGVISVIAQAFPQTYSHMINLGLKGNAESARKIHYKLKDAFSLGFNEGNPTGIKTFLYQQGFCENLLRLPLIKASNQLESEIRNYLEHF